MNEGWVKLHRKMNENALISDSKASHVFLWLLINVDRKSGSIKIGRFWLSKILHIKPSTLYKILKRLEKERIVTLKSNNEFTIVSLLNWAKYQASNERVTPQSNSKVTAKEQQSNTLQEVENKELRIERDTSLDYLLSVPSNDLAEFTVAFTCTDRQVINKAQSLYDYCQSRGKKYKDYKAFLRNALRKDFGDRIQSQQFVPDLPTEVSEVGLARLKEMKDRILTKN